MNILYVLVCIFLRINERRYEFGDKNGDGGGWVCAKIPDDGRLVKDCVPHHEAPSWYKHLQEDIDFQGCNGGVCYCDDRDGCNTANTLHFRTVFYLVGFLIIVMRNNY